MKLPKARKFHKSDNIIVVMAMFIIIVSKNFILALNRNKKTILKERNKYKPLESE